MPSGGWRISTQVPRWLNRVGASAPALRIWLQTARSALGAITLAHINLNFKVEDAIPRSSGSPTFKF